MAQHTLSRRNTRSTRAARSRLPLLLIGGGVIFLIVALVVALAADRPGEKVPTISLLDGSSVNLADYRGHVVLLNFWASWCPPCRAEMPVLDAYYQRYKDSGFVLIAINSGESASTASRFIQSTPYTFIVGIDPTNQFSGYFGITGLPISIVFDKQGDIQYRHTGQISPDVLDAQVTPLLASR